jgi:N-acetylglutamate synthase-like GNAT family acetyltransferase/DNA-binding MarR family transcriptional regulator
MNTDLIAELGELALGTRMRRFSEQIMTEGEEIYRQYGVGFNPRWFPVFYYLHRFGPTQITRLSDALGISHPAVIRLAKEMQAGEWIVSKSDPKDKRRRLLELSTYARDNMPLMEQIWQDIAQALHGVIQDSGYPTLKMLHAMEQAVLQRPFPERVKFIRAARVQEGVLIKDYEPELGEHFKRINYDWIRKYFVVEDVDVKSLENHQEVILDSGGAILFAELNGEIVGTCALKHEGDGVFELCKMGVDEHAQGQQVGRKLGIASLEKARELGARSVFLESNKKLKPALNLYRRLGFVEVPGDENSEYQRSDIRMEWIPN